ncbi:MAG TPA: GlsB/YeaQ/YmgE family stress response membrane protein [Bryobacteraceae bacterium]|nr:GlsB/YeaQ/YmgE family stress response membrane protein [Bryobacteraceae bacterium]
MLSFISLVLFGLVVGVIAKLLMPGRDPGGFIITILLGIAGAVLGGYVGRLMGFYGPNEGAGFFMALLGSIILLAIYRLTLRRGTAV